MLTKEKLTPYALELFRRVKESLPTEIGERLRSNRKFVTHGSYRTLFLFDVWDCNQTDVLNRQHFKYCLGYDGRPNATCDGYFHLWLNRIRIYREREAIVSTLDRKLPKLVPKGFFWNPSDRAFDIKFEFDYPKNLTKLPDLLLSKYVSLIKAIHPVLLPLIDQFTTPLDTGERRAVVAKRGRLAFTLPGVYDRKRVREYTRSIPPAWRIIVLKRHGYRCANPKCRADLRKVQHHIDHVIPFSKGGTTTLENLQALCEPCNLAKGNRQ
jgi:5-methylcytosine-specific restriction enzyme A